MRMLSPLLRANSWYFDLLFVVLQTKSRNMTTDNYPSWDAKAFDEPEFQGLFREIHFAIIEDHNSHGRNYNSFKEVFG